ncbi:MAG: hypothetical protein ACOYLK_17135 [Sphingomonas sp.]
MKYAQAMQSNLEKMNQVNSDAVPSGKRPLFALEGAIRDSGATFRDYDGIRVVVTKQQSKQMRDLMDQFEDGEISEKPNKWDYCTPFSEIAKEHGV